MFESVLTTLRAYVFSHTTSRIDVELGARLFRHLLALPLAYFQARRVGDSVARVRELENIRSFLTGNAMTVVLDLLFSLVFLAVMAFYSVPLTLIVLASLPLYVALSLVVAPILRRRLDVKFARGAESQAHAGRNRHRHPDRQGRRRWSRALAGAGTTSSRPTYRPVFAPRRWPAWRTKAST